VLERAAEAIPPPDHQRIASAYEFADAVESGAFRDRAAGLVHDDLVTARRSKTSCGRSRFCSQVDTRAWPIFRRRSIPFSLEQSRNLSRCAETFHLWLSLRERSSTRHMLQRLGPVSHRPQELPLHRRHRRGTKRAGFRRLPFPAASPAGLMLSCLPVLIESASHERGRRARPVREHRTKKRAKAPVTPSRRPA
jgi:hypothetical protein